MLSFLFPCPRIVSDSKLSSDNLRLCLGSHHHLAEPWLAEIVVSEILHLCVHVTTDKEAVTPWDCCNARGGLLSGDHGGGWRFTCRSRNQLSNVKVNHPRLQPEGMSVFSRNCGVASRSSWQSGGTCLTV